MKDKITFLNYIPGVRHYEIVGTVIIRFNIGNKEPIRQVSLINISNFSYSIERKFNIYLEHVENLDYDYLIDLKPFFHFERTSEDDFLCKQSIYEYHELLYVATAVKILNEED